MASLIVVESALGQFVDDVAQIWAGATAKRDNDAEIAPLALSRPVIDAVLSSSVRSRLLVAVDATGQVVGFTPIEPPAGDRGAAEVRYLGVLPSVWGSGVATALLAAVPKWLSAAGFTSLLNVTRRVSRTPVTLSVSSPKAVSRS
jgi:GNAT superfamily N-acetyltransferase